MNKKNRYNPHSPVCLLHQIKKRYNFAKSLRIIKPCVGQRRWLSGSRAEKVDIMVIRSCVPEYGKEKAAYPPYPFQMEMASLMTGLESMDVMESARRGQFAMLHGLHVVASAIYPGFRS